MVLCGMGDQTQVPVCGRQALHQHPHPQPLEPDSYLPVVYMQEAVDQPRDRQREPKERKNGKKRGKSEEKAGGWCISGGGGVGAFGSKG